MKPVRLGFRTCELWEHESHVLPSYTTPHSPREVDRQNVQVHAQHALGDFQARLNGNQAHPLVCLETPYRSWFRRLLIIGFTAVM
jgi:hypothetical protein